MIAYILVTTFLALFWLFRSVVLPLKALLMNAISIFASYGVLVYIFQQGHLQGVLGFTAQGFTEATLPILMFCLLFGLSMDYEIFLLSRVKEAYDRTGDSAASVVSALVESRPPTPGESTSRSPPRSSSRGSTTSADSSFCSLLGLPRSET